MLRSGIIFIFVLWVSALWSWRVAAQPDTLSELPLSVMGVDSGRTLDILHKFTWRITAKRHNGTIVNYTTRRPDTALGGGFFDTVTLAADFVVDSSLASEVLALHYTLEGSLLADMNGKRIVETGKFTSSSTYQLRRYAPNGRSWFRLSDGVQHLRVVYVPYERTHVFELSLKFDSKEAADFYLQRDNDDRDNDRGIAFYYLAFGIVFLSLFVSARRHKEYLSFALFCLFGAVSYILSTVDFGFLYNLESFAGLFCFEFLAMFLCQVLLGRDRSIWPLVIIVASLCICALPAVRYYYATAVTAQAPVVIGAVYLVLYPYTACSVLYYLVRGVGKKQWEARAIVLVCLVPIIAVVVVGTAATIFVGFRMQGKQTQYAWLVPFMINYLAAAIVYVYPLSAVYIVGRRNRQTQATLEAQVVAIGKLSEENLEKEKEKQHILERQKEDLEREVSQRTAQVVTQKDEIERQHAELKIEKKKSDDLLRNILPEEVAAELKAKGHTEAKLFDNVTVLFTDFVNFTIAGEQMTPQELIDELHTCFKAFDEITVKYNLEKIKTIGDAYLAVCGLPVADYKHAEKVVSAAKEINAFMQQRVLERGSGSFNIRIGVHSGPVVAGIVGVKKFAYDVWGDTVNTAARLEQKGEPGRINISQSTYELVKDAFTCEYRGEIAAKNKGPMKMYFVL